MATTAQLRQMYSPACRPGMSFAPAYAALDACLKAHGYRVRQSDTGAQSCRKITGGSGYSLHAYFGNDSFTFWTGVRIPTAVAVDINWNSNPYGPRLITDMPRAMIDDILAIRTNSGARVWGWGGYYRGNKDAMHFEIICSPADLRSGINQSTVAGQRPPPVQEDDEEEDDMQWMIKSKDKPEWWVTNWIERRHVRDREEANLLAYLGVKHGGKDGVAPVVVEQEILDRIPKV